VETDSCACLVESGKRLKLVLAPQAFGPAMPGSGCTKFGSAPTRLFATLKMQPATKQRNFFIGE
jgi:hypothetical protein